jgi:glycosyltransferase involved in cell wall biosynthesis
VTHLDRRRYKPIVWCNAPVVAAAARDLGVVAEEFGEWGDRGAIVPTGPHLRAARDIVRRHRVELVHANDVEPLKALLPAAFGARVPVVAHLHLRLTPEERRWSLVHQATVAVGVSETAVRGLREDRFATSRTAVIYNAVDAARLGEGDASALRASLGIGADDVVFAAVGSLIPRKGVDVTLRAFAALASERGDCRLLVCGDGPAEGELRAQAAASPAARHVHFLGRRADVGAVLRDATQVLVSAARDETFGLTLAEAAVFGVPAVASSIDAHREVVVPGRTGVLVPVDDAPALAAAMRRLADDPSERRRLGADACAAAAVRFTVERYTREFDELYARLLAAPRARYGWIQGVTWPQVYTTWARAALRRRADVLAAGARRMAGAGARGMA